jgi:hypothetical protein
VSSARQHVTERYILECDEVFAVADIARASTDESVKDVIKLAKKNARVSNVGIICTKSDVRALASLSSKI